MSDKKQFGNISDFLKKFQGFIPSDTLIKEAVIKVINKELKTNIDKNNIRVQKTTLFIDTSPVIKQEIQINKEKILLLINEELPNLTIKEII